MPFQSAPECATAAIEYLVNSQTCVNRLNFAFPGGYEQSAIDDLAEAVDLAVHDNILPLMAAAAGYVRTEVRGLENIIDLSAVAATHAGAGSISGGALPNNVTFAIKLGTGATGRSARGRIFMVGLSGSSLDTTLRNTLLSSAANSMVAGWENFQSDVLASGWQLVVLSRFSNGVKRSVATHRAVTDISYTDLVVDSQRGRLG